MIARMKKYAFLTYHKEYDAFLETLRSVGVVHISEKKSVSENTDLWALSAVRKRISAVLDYSRQLHEGETDFPPAQASSQDDNFHTISEIEALREQENHLTAEQQRLHKEIDYMQFWGDFDFDNIKKMKDAGYEVLFFTCPTEKFNPKWEEDYDVVIINEFKSVSYFVAITKSGGEISIEAEHAKMPEAGLQKLHEKLKRVEKDIENIENKLKEKTFAVHNTLEEFDRDVENEYNFIKTHAQADAKVADKVMLLEGWTTAEQAPAMEAELDAKGYYFQPEEIVEEDNVPVQLKNNAYVRLFEPITKLFSLPNYREFDPTPLFAPFFMLFFGLCFSDAGYGLLILITASILKGRLKPDMRPICRLAQWLGGTAVVVGLLITGTLFGIELVAVPALAPVKNYFLSHSALMQLAVFIGILHILFAKTVSAYKKYAQRGLKYSLSHWGWLFLLASLAVMYSPAVLTIFGEPLEFIPPLPQVVKYILYGVMAVSGFFIVFYNSPEKNIFFNFGLSLWNIYSAVTGLLGDVLSYIRLFAIGLSGAILGSVFNMLAFETSADFPIIARIPFVLFVLLFGHSINIGLSLIASLVHPVRLVFVEYYKNSEFEGGGADYTPFKKV